MRVPSYRHHKPTGQAFLRIKGKNFYLGKYCPCGGKGTGKQCTSPDSHAKYEQLLGEYLASGRDQKVVEATKDQLTIEGLTAAYKTHAKGYYVDGEYKGISSMCARLVDLCGKAPAAKFSPAMLRKYQDKAIKAGNSRKYINQQTHRLRCMFRWAVSRELLQPEVWQRLMAVDTLKQGRSEAKDRPKVLPVSDEHLNAVLECCPDDLADMLSLQRRTGMRPNEVWQLRPCDIDRTGEVWEYRPQRHKTQHHGKDRVIYFGPQSQAVLAQYLLRGPRTLCFDNNGKPWNRHTYRDHIHRACDRAEMPHFNANQIRHSLATEVRTKFGLEGAQVMLGHSKADVTEIYAELNNARGAEIAKKLG